jgi:hypothetical protein
MGVNEIALHHVRKTCDILEVKNARVKSLHYVIDYSSRKLVQFNLLKPSGNFTYDQV